VIFILSGYLIGSVPVAYLTVRARSGMDIREKGSGNVGGFNAYAVTGSRGVGIVTGLLDGLKGLLAASAAAISTGDFRLSALTLCAAVVGHLFPIWLRFRGGRGLATACGGLLILCQSYIVVWCSFWLIGRGLHRSILASNVGACSVTPLVLLLVPAGFLQLPAAWAGDAASLRLFAGALSGLLLLGHRGVLRGALAEWTRRSTE
jgi:glycerol-3-phosphate acyltransferase PlsY